MKLFTILFFFTLSCNLLYAKNKTLHILIFNSYNQTLPWSKQLLKGMENFDTQSPYAIKYYIETIDYIRLKKQMDSKEWEHYLSKKYESIVFDGVVIDTIFASEVFQKFSNRLYPDIPKIYLSEIDITHDTNTQKILESKPLFVQKTIQVAKKHNKNFKTAYIIKSSKAGESLEKILQQKLQKESLETVLIENFTIEELQHTLANLPKNSAVFYTINFEDSTGKKFVPKEFLEKISQTSNSPIYSFWSTFIGTGTLGGYMFDGESAMQSSLNSLVYFIENKKFNKINFDYTLFLDYQVLKKYSFKNEEKNAVILNKPIPIWKLYPLETYFALSVIGLLSLLLFLTFILKLRNEKILQMEKSMFIQSKQAAMGEMISVIAHQWRQPLNNIALIVQTIFLKYTMKKIDQTLMEKFKVDVLKQIHYMSNTVDDFKDFYKPNKEKVTFDIKQELIKTIELTSVMYQKESITLEYRDLQSALIVGYPTELTHCFLILLQNANEALQESTQKEKKIKIQGKKEKNEYILIFENNGDCIPLNILEKIFEPYFSTKSEKNGTGIGLYMAKTIIEKHFQGSLKVFNIQNGVKFEIRVLYD